ncbi:uncharacterized protein EAF02_001358 [Botrytis sinoallii]|uniref:uncharacterized protein n=1 Tax=Botrytis sinoallii TaxID=1463999 RepID=UPI0018FF3CD1|nr:uncharacterized protein EAF02_001358 [Botrytis sinoallii]KAF7891033.1 hypothetical protein EAF02_001358 [Botrytis sinoallii]
MADPVGFTASVIGIATLAVQLGDALRKAAEFWEAVQDAPSDIRRLSKQLRLVASVFHTIRLEYEAGSIPTNFESMVNDALELAKDDIDQLSEFISVLSRKLSVANGSLGRQWRKVQMVLKASKIERFRDNLESVKTTMALLQGSRQQASLIRVSSRLDVLSTNISSIATTINSTHHIALQTSQEMTQSQSFPSGGWKSTAGSVSKSFNQYKTNFLLGTLNFRTISTTHRYNDDDGTDDADNSTTTKTFLVELLMGFTTCRKGFRFTTTSTFDHLTLDVVRRRPNNSEIFRLCEHGNTQGVKRLLDRGEASVHDVDEDGESLLHIALWRDNSQLCTMLLDLGADVHWEVDDGDPPISVASALTSFAAIVEAGFELWPFFVSRSGGPFYRKLSISVWRYIFQHKPAQPIGNDPASMLPRVIVEAEDAEVVDFSVARVAEDLFQLGTFDSFHSGNIAQRMISDLVGTWLVSLSHHWFFGKEKFEVILFEYKIALILKQILKPLYLRESNGEHLPRTITDIYIEGVVEIIKACLWSVGITNAVFRIWSKPFFELGIDLFPHHPRTESDGQENSDEGGSDEKNIPKRHLKGHIIHCCKGINYSVVHEHQQDNLSIEIDVTTLPEYSHLDPLFLCEAGRPRCDRTGVGRCLSQVDEAFVENGKFSKNMPGQWEEPLVPNTTMRLLQHSISFEPPQICYSMVQELDEAWCTFVTEADIQRIEQDLRNGTLYGLSEDTPKNPGEE